MAYLKHADNFIKDFSLDIYNLRILEIQVMKSSKSSSTYLKVDSRKVKTFLKAHRLFVDLLHRLNSRKKFIKDSSCWKELYDRSIFYYNFYTYLIDIPICRVTSHNHIVPWYAKQLSSSKYDGIPIVHFDTHEDMNDIEDSNKLLKYTDKKQYSKIGEVVWDIGAAMSGILLSTGIRDQIWIMPSWIKNTTGVWEYAINYKKQNRVYSADDCSDMTNMPFDKRKTWVSNEGEDIALYSRQHFNNKSQWKKVYEFISENSNKYILDIDLDYFICNGTPYNDSYLEENYDVSSYYRTQEVEMIRTPRFVYEDSNSDYKRYSKKLTKEIHEVDKRIKQFLKGLKYLRQKGLVPVLISISDSTSANFSSCTSCSSVSNSYVPRLLALYIHNKIIKGLCRVLD